MRRALTLLNQNCRIATRLVSDAQDRPLDRLERAGLAIHLMGCRNCSRYRKQIRMLEQIVKTVSDSPDATDALPPAAHERISQNLKKGG